MRCLSFICVFSLAVFFANAQDVIWKKDGTKILAKVIEVNTDNIKYKKYSNQSGPIYTLYISSISSINYQNGDREDYESNGNIFLISQTHSDNKQLISEFNKDNSFIGYNLPINSKKKYRDRVSRWIRIAHISESSVLHNQELKVSFVYQKGKYNIKLDNESNNIIYLDLGNSFEIYKNGLYQSYYDNSEYSTTTSSVTTYGNSTGVGLSLGSIANMFGIGGALGNLANSTQINSSNNQSLSSGTYQTVTKSQERIISIPPHASYMLTNSIWIGATNTIRQWKIGEEMKYTEDISPFKNKYAFTYSNQKDFKTYSTISLTLYLFKEIGIPNIEYSHDDGKIIISNFNDKIIWF